eukprot:m.740247 g.740247  ORF g.740247 m.740247 type:complete len:445 (-) comp58926_c0_seq1:110-1444(-)
MAERKTVNKYYPPDYDPSKGSINKHVGQHPLRDRARKLDQGILIIRFELPYNIWCHGCKKMIGMGTRFNAEKKKVGNYYSTPIYSFNMKCAECPNRFTIETDPKNCDYKITVGAQRKVENWDPEDAESATFLAGEEKLKIDGDAMFRLEHGVGDAAKAKQSLPALQRLHDLQSRMKDDYDLNSLLRKANRTERKIIKKQKEVDDKLLKKASLDIVLLPEQPEDIRHASLIKFGHQGAVDKVQVGKEALKRRSIFSTKTATAAGDSVAASAPVKRSASASGLSDSGTSKRAKAADALLKRDKALRHGQAFALDLSLSQRASSAKSWTKASRQSLVVQKSPISKSSAPTDPSASEDESQDSSGSEQDGNDKTATSTSPASSDDESAPNHAVRGNSHDSEQASAPSTSLPSAASSGLSSPAGASSSRASRSSLIDYPSSDDEAEQES